MNTVKYEYYVGDFETTVYEGQEYTEVWASACVALGSEDVQIFHSIDEQFEYFKSLNKNICVYYHNLKFDGAFWLSFLLKDLKFKQAFLQEDKNDINTISAVPIKKMKNNTFNYSISNLGAWYRLTIKVNDKIIEIRDSLKLLPFSVKQIGKSFGTKHKKLDMEYEGFRYAGCEITDEEKKYIANDVLVIKEALEIMFAEGHKKLTIGSCCLSEYKNLIGKKTYDKLFPNMYEFEIDEKYGELNAGDYIKKAYRGGWCYLNPDKAGQVIENGITADVNSLYPSVMSSESGSAYPVGYPTFWKGDYIPDMPSNSYYFIRIKTRFYLKDGFLPFIQIKNNLMYTGNENLITSDIKNPETGDYVSEYLGADGEVKSTAVVLTMTCTDFELFKEHYNLVDTEILDGCYFRSAVGIFDNYIEKYKNIKINSKGAKRQLAKLFLNNLYGKMASSKNSSFKVAYLKGDKSIGFYTVVANDKLPGYIPVGAAITSYARNFTIRAAQKNYNKNGRGFIYADTDSIHCDLNADEVEGINIHDKNFCCWKLESFWDKAIFVRQKTYIEHVTHEDGEKVDVPYYEVKCAGMPARCKDLFLCSLGNKKIENLNEEEKKFVKTKRELTDFKVGLKVPSKLLPKRIKGGIVLLPTTFEMR